jgi:hypothetical protein
VLGVKKHIAYTTKKDNARVIICGTIKTPKKNIILKGWRRLNVNQTNSSKNSLNPKVRWSREVNHKSMRSIK